MIPIVLILIIIISCEKDKPASDNIYKTNFKIGDNSYLSSQTNLYITEFGKIIETYNDDFKLFIVLSDKSGTSFEITDTLKADNESAARCILKIANDYHFSSAGALDLGADNKTGNMEISFENINLNDGKLFIDSVITKPYIDFTKITATDFQGAPMNSVDENDWTIRNDFQIPERLIFNENSEFLYKDLALIEYPNPFNDIIQLRIDINQDENIDLFLVNENFEIEQKVTQLQSGNYAFLLDNPDYIGNYYRLYYKIYSDNEKYYGSGDLKVDE
jgi:hypothetical protein